MTTTAAPPRKTTNGPPAVKAPLKFQRIASGAVDSVRLVINGVEGFGKTTIGSQAPEPAILMARGETGYVTLRKAGLVPDCDVADFDNWQDVLDGVDSLKTTTHKSIVLDALGGFERLCHEHVCTREFDGEWGEKGFQAYQRGYDVSIASWLQLLQRLDAVRATRPCNIIILSHAKPTKSRDPLAPEFDRWVADCHAKTWAATSRWADAVLFGTFVTVVDEKRGKKARGIGGTERVIHTEHHDGYDAKNRYGLPPTIAMDGADTMWSTIWSAINHETPDEIPA